MIHGREYLQHLGLSSGTPFRIWLKLKDETVKMSIREWNIERWRIESGEFPNIITTELPMLVRSYGLPEIRQESIYVVGKSQMDDNRTDEYGCRDEAEALEHFTKIVITLERLAILAVDEQCAIYK